MSPVTPYKLAFLSDEDLLAQAIRIDMVYVLMGENAPKDMCPYCGEDNMVYDTAGPLDTPAAWPHFSRCDSCGAYPMQGDDVASCDVEEHTGWIRPQL